MFGSNYFGQPQFGQSSAIAANLYTTILTATVATAATLARFVTITLAVATATPVATLVSLHLYTLRRLTSTFTKFLNGARQTFGLSGFNRSTKRIL